MSEFACTRVEALAAELALGILPGEQRAEALEHLAGCPACRDKVDQLAHVVDQLLLAAPEAEPPLGFESRVLARLDAQRPTDEPSLHRWRRWATVATAAAVLVVAAGLLGRQSSQPSSPAGAQVAVVGFGSWTCRVAAFSGHGAAPTELVVRLDEPSDVAHWYTVEAEPASSGAPLPLGTIHVSNGHGTLTASVPPRAGKVRGIRVFESGQTLTYTATFAPV